jgi:hypothetical protein
MEDDWEVVRKDRGWSMGGTGIGILRITLLFGSAAVALAMILTPIVDRQTRNYAAERGPLFGVDDTTTGSIRSSRSFYTIHKSVLQSSPDAVCVIRHDGRRQGDC